MSALERLNDWLEKGEKKMAMVPAFNSPHTTLRGARANAKVPAMSHRDHFHANEAAKHAIHAEIHDNDIGTGNNKRAKLHEKLARMHASQIKGRGKGALLSHYHEYHDDRYHGGGMRAPAVKKEFVEHKGQKPKKTW